MEVVVVEAAEDAMAVELAHLVAGVTADLLCRIAEDMLAAETLPKRPTAWVYLA